MNVQQGIDSDGGPVARGPLTVSQGVDWYLSAKLGVLRPETWAKHRVTLLQFAREFGDYELDAVSREDVRGWRAERRVKPSSANKYVGRIKALYEALDKEGLFAGRNPADIDPLDEPAVRRVRLPNETLPLMLDAARHPRDRALIATALELLLRGGELAELRVGDVLDGCLRVVVEKQKGELAVDEMAISSQLERSLRDWLHVYRASVGIVTAEAYLFPRMDTVRQGTENRYALRPTAPLAHPEEVIKLALRAAGVPAPVGTGVHAIRRTCARLLFDHLVTEAGVDRALGHVSSLMHHSSRRTTELYLGQTGDRVLRNKLVRNGVATPLMLATIDKTAPSVSVELELYRDRKHTV